MTQFNVGFATDIGKKRLQNQDSGTALPELGIFIVADGMGGHRGGETASAMAVDIISKTLETNKQAAKPEKDILESAVKEASRLIYEKSTKHPELQGMGTTATILFSVGQKFVIGQVGDSRCYYIRDGLIWQLTRDHSLVAEKIRAGLITREQARTDKMKNVITRSVGFEVDVNVETFELTPRSGDVYLLCSDGLSGMIDDFEIAKTVTKNLSDENNPKKAADELVTLANNNGGDDNITVIVVQVR
ncbi:MAG: hypothetical protein A3K03_02700 [Bdellovibrionales bacterium RIFOXYD1_FULL_44_7]|nr:MAG: hypothetical protein A3K03_02700 [Bdellovibrionales bacterium RIFOXYD1_FULL_44_7]